MDGIELEIVWSNLISIVSEQAKALRRIAFSPIVREAGDLANALFDRRGRMVAQAVTGTPGHINSLAAAGKHFVEAFPTQTLNPGDVLITNDPWLSAGHFFDITVMLPAFHKNRLIGFFGSTIHHTDIGGYGVGAGARDVHEEGLWIPMLKLYEAGEPSKVLHEMIRRNVRTPDHVFGDLAAQVSSGRLACKRLSALLDRQGYDDIDEISEEVISRSEQSTRQSIRKLKPGIFHGESQFDVPGGDVITLKTAVTIDAKEGEIHIDFAGSSEQGPYGINVVMNYTHAYSTFAIRSCLDPELPNNFGSLAPIKVTAPEGCIVNCKYPAPVNARQSSACMCRCRFSKRFITSSGPRAGRRIGRSLDDPNSGQERRRLAVHEFDVQLLGGMGARRTKDGPSATCYPTGVAAVPVEVLEASMPIVFNKKELRIGSGGAGASRGGDGKPSAGACAPLAHGFQRGREPHYPCTRRSRRRRARRGWPIPVNGKAVTEARKMVMQPNDEVTLETPGGGRLWPAG